MIARDNAIVAAHMIQARTSAAAALEVRVEDPVVVEPAELEAVLVTASSDRMNVEPADDDMVRRRRVTVVATVIDVEPVRRRAGQLEAFDDDELRFDEMHRLTAARDHWHRLALRTSDPDRRLRGPA